MGTAIVGLIGAIVAAVGAIVPQAIAAKQARISQQQAQILADKELEARKLGIAQTTITKEAEAKKDLNNALVLGGAALTTLLILKS